MTEAATIPRRLNFHVLTVFPEMIESALSFGVISQAMKAGLLGLTALSPRRFTTNVHQTIDDRPFGGGDGMVMIPEPMSLAMDEIRRGIPPERRVRVIHLSPRGRMFCDEKARELAAGFDDLILIASRYAGLDQRFINDYVDEELSIGDYVVSGGEFPALVVIDAVARCVPGVLGNDASAHDESFAPGMRGLEFPQYTRPREWRGHEVPAELLSGDHAKIARWKSLASILVTADARPELLKNFSVQDRAAAREILAKKTEAELREYGLKDRARLLDVLRPDRKWE